MEVNGQVIALYKKYSCNILYLILSNVYNSFIINVDCFVGILAVGCIYLRSFDALSMSTNKYKI